MNTNANKLKTIARKALAATLAACLAVGYVPAYADSEWPQQKGSVGEQQDVVQGSGSTNVNVITLGMSILGQTDDVTAAVTDIKTDAQSPEDKRKYVLKVVVTGANAEDCSFAWTRATVGEDGEATPDEAFTDDRPVHPLIDDANAGLLETNTTYRYSVRVTDSVSGTFADTSILVTVSDDYLDRTLQHESSRIGVTGPIHKELSDADLVVEALDASAPTYGFLLDGAEGLALQSAWNVRLAAAPHGMQALGGPVSVSLPTDLPDEATVKVAHLSSDGSVKLLDAQVREGFAIVGVDALGAFAVAVEPAATYEVDASAGEGGTVSPVGAIRYAEGAQPAYTLLPNAGYAVEGVSVDGGPVEPVEGNVYTFAPLDADHAIEARFRAVETDDDAVHLVSARAAGQGGLVAIDGGEPAAEQSARVSHGRSTTVEFSPDDGWTLERVTVKTGEGEPVEVRVFGDAFLISAVEADTVVEATFREGAVPPVAVHTVSAQVVDEHGSVTPAQTLVPHGRSATFTLAPDEGWQVDSVVLDGEDDVTARISGSTFVLENVVEDHTLTVSHAEKPVVYTIEASATTGGSIAPSGSVAVDEGGSATFICYPDDGYVLDRLIVDGQALTDPDRSYTFDNVQADHTIRAVFRAEGGVEPPAPTYATVRATAGEHGSISPAGDVRVDLGADAPFALIADQGYQVDQVLVDGVAVEAPDAEAGSFVLTGVRADASLHVTFKKGEAPAVFHTLTASATTGGSISPAGDVLVADGGSAAFRIASDDGWHLAKLLVDGEETAVEGTTFKISDVRANHTVHAVFEHGEVQPPAPGYVTVSATAGEHGAISPAGDVRVEPGADATFALVPDRGYEVDEVLVDGEAVEAPEAAAGSFTLSGVEADASVHVTFKRGSAPAAFHTVSASAGQGGSISPAGDVLVADGGTLSLLVSANEGWRVARVLVDGEEAELAGSTLELTDVRADRTVRAEFERVGGEEPDPDNPDNPDNPDVPDVPGPGDFVTVDVKVQAQAVGSAGGLVSPSGMLTLPYGSSQTFYAYPFAGRTLETVLVNGEPVGFLPVGPVALMARAAVGASGCYRFSVESVTENLDVQVVFGDLAEDEEPPVPVETHAVAASASTGGMISPSGTTWVPEGASTTFALKADDGWRLKSLKVDDADVTDQVEGSVFELASVQADTRVRAEFEQLIQDPEPSAYVTVHASAGAGGLISPAGDVHVKRGGSQSFVFLPDAGHALDRVVVDGKAVEVENGSLTLSDLEADASVRAEFRALEPNEPDPVLPVVHTVNATASAGGSVSPSGDTLVAEGGSLSLTFMPDAGFELAKVTDGDADVTEKVAGGVYLLENVTENHEVVAEFAPKTGGGDEPAPEPTSIVVRASAGEGGSISPAGDVHVKRGASQTFAFLPDDGFTLNEVTVDGEPVEVTDGSYTLTDLAADAAIRAEFRALDPDEPAPDLPVVHEVTAMATSGGSVSPSGVTKVVDGKSLLLTFEPDEGYKLASVMLDGLIDVTAQIEDGAYLLKNVGADHAVVAVFVRDSQGGGEAPAPEPTYATVHASASAGGSISPAGDVHVKLGKSQEFVFLPNDGFVLDRVTVDGKAVEVVDNAYTLTDVRSDVVIRAEFRELESDEPAPALPIVHEVTATATTGGTVSPSGSTLVIDGKSLLFMFLPDAGYELIKVTMDGEADVTEQVKDGTYLLENVTRDHAVAAVFSPVSGGGDVPEPAYATLHASASKGGAISPAGDVQVKRGESQTFSFVPDEGFVLNFVTVDGRQVELEGASYTIFNVQADADIRAEFRERTPEDPEPTPVIMHTVSAAATTGGTVSPAGDTLVADGGSLLLTFVPDEGYELANVLVDGRIDVTGQAKDGAYRLSDVTRDHSVVAVFAPKVPDVQPPAPGYVTVSATAGEHGTISPAGDVRVEPGADATFTLIADQGYEVDQVLVDGEAVEAPKASAGSFTLSGVEADASVHVTFKRGAAPEAFHTVSVSAGQGGSVSPAGDVLVADGGSLSLLVSPDEGWRVVRVLVDGKEAELAGSTLVLTDVRANRTVRAEFERVQNPDEESGLAVVHASAGEGGRISPEGDVRVSAGEAQTFTLLPDEGWRVASVEANGQSVPVIGSTATLYNLTGEQTLRVEFERTDEPQKPVATHTVRATAGRGGTVSPAGETQVADGASLLVSLLPDEGWHVKSLTVDGVLLPDFQGASYRFDSVVGDRTLEATFERDIDAEPAPSFVTVKAEAGAGGSISPAGEVLVPKGAAQTFYLYPDEGKKVASLTIDGRSFAFSGSSYTLFGVSADTSVRAEFADLESGEAQPPEPTTHEVCARVEGAGGSVSPVGPVRVVHGGSLLVSLVPDEGYAADEVHVNGKLVQKGGTSVRLANVDADAEVVATFRQLGSEDPDMEQPFVKANVRVVGAGGTVSPSGSVALAFGSSQTFYAYPHEGYDLDQVLVNDEPLSYFPAGGTDPLARTAAAGAAGAYRFTVESATEDLDVQVLFRELAEDEVQPAPVKTYAVAASASTGGMISPSGTVWVPEGASLTYSMKADAGWKLKSLTVDGVNVTAWVRGGTYALTDVQAACEVRAEFERTPVVPEPVYVTVHASAGKGGSVSPAGDVRVKRGESQTFVFMPDAGYVLDRVTVDGDPVAAVDGSLTLFDLAADASVRAEFRPRTTEDPEPVVPVVHTVSASASTGGMVSPSGSTLVAHGGSLLLTFVPDAGFELAKVTDGGQDVTEQAKDGAYRLTNVVEDHAVTAEFAPRAGEGDEPAPAPTYATVHASAGEHGAISPAGDVRVDLGADALFALVPDAGYEVDQVLVDGEAVEASDAAAGSFALRDVRSDASVHVTFKAGAGPAVFHTVRASATAGGTISPAGEVLVADGGSTSFRIAAEEGYHVAQLLVDGEEAELVGTTFTLADVRGDRTVQAVFERIDDRPDHPSLVTVHASAGEGGAISPAGDVRVPFGSAQMFTLLPDEGWAVDSVTANGKPLYVRGSTVTLFDLVEETDLRATFTRTDKPQPPVVTHTVTTSASRGGTVSPLGETTVAEGGNLLVSLVPDEGWRLKSLTVDGVLLADFAGASYRFENVTGDRTLAAVFEREGGEEPAPSFVSVAASAGEGGSISPAGNLRVPKGSSQTFYFYPDAGKKVSSLVVDGRTFAFSGSMFTLFGVEASSSIRVEFADLETGDPVPPAQTTHTVTARVEGAGGTVSPAGATKVLEGGSLLVALEADEGYVTGEVRVNGEVVQKGGTYVRLANVGEDLEVVATFKERGQGGLDPDDPDANQPFVTVDVKVQAGAAGSAGGMVSPSGTLTLAYGASQTFYAYPFEGHALDEVLVNGEPIAFSPIGATPLRARMVAGAAGGYCFAVESVTEDLDVQVLFRELAAGEEPPAAVETYAVTASASTGGMISPSGVSWMPAGGSVTYSVKADAGWRLTTLAVGDVDVTDQVRGGAFTLTDVQAAADVRAEFEQRPFTPEPAPYVTVHASSSLGGSISPEGDVRVKRGESQTFVFLPNDGYVLNRVTVDGNPVVPIDSTYTLFDLTDDAEVRAEFRPRTAEDPEPILPVVHKVRATASTGGMVSPAGETLVPVGGSLLFTFVADAGYELVSVTVDGRTDVTEQARGGAYRLTNVTEDHSISAIFAPKTDAEQPVPAWHTVVASSGEHGLISPEGEVRVAHGSTVQFSLLPDEGYIVDELTVDGRAVTPSGSFYTLFDVSADANVHVTFKEGDGPAIERFTVEASAGEHGAVSPVGAAVYAAGAEPVYTFVPDEGYVVDTVRVDGMPLVNPASTYRFAPLAANHTLEVAFRASDEPPTPPADSYRVSASASEGGSIDPSGEMEVASGETVRFTLAANEGYALHSLTVNGAIVTSSVADGAYELGPVTANAEVVATFEPVVVPVTYHEIAARVDGGHGSVSPSGTVKVAEGASQTFYFHPDDGYVVDALTVDGQAVARPGASYTFADVQAAHELVVTFKPAPSVGPNGGGNGGGNGSGNGGVGHNAGKNPVDTVKDALSTLVKLGDGMGLVVVALAALAAGAGVVAVRTRRRRR